MDTKLCDKCKESKNFLYTFGLQKSNQLITCKIIMKLNSVKCFGTLSICPHPYKSILVRGGPFAKLEFNSPRFPFPGSPLYTFLFLKSSIAYLALHQLCSLGFLAFLKTGFLWLEKYPWIVLIVHPNPEVYIRSDFTHKIRFKERQSKSYVHLTHIQVINLMFSVAPSTKTIPKLHCIFCLTQQHVYSNFFHKDVVFLGSIRLF